MIIFTIQPTAAAEIHTPYNPVYKLLVLQYLPLTGRKRSGVCGILLFISYIAPQGHLSLSGSLAFRDPWRNGCQKRKQCI